MNTLTIRLFGSPTITIDHRQIHFESRKAVALIAYLAVAAEARPRAELATLLWPESDQKRARGALRYTLSLLRKELGSSWLDAGPQYIGLSQANPVYVDVPQFRSLLAACTSHEHATNIACPDCVPLLIQAVELYTEDFLAGFSLRDSTNFDEWQFFQSETLRRDLASALQRLAHFQANRSDYESALTHAHRWLQLDPLQEEAQRTVMQIYASAGRWTDALRQYEECARLLGEELGVDPSPKTQALMAEIEQNAQTNRQRSPSSTTATVRQARAHNLPTPTTPIVGREDDVASLFDLLLTDECRLLTLLGPGGIGKTRLALSVAHQLVEQELAPIRKNDASVRLSDGIFFASLVAVHDEAGLMATLADVLGLSFTGGESPKIQIFNFLHDRHLLLVLDNFEQLVALTKLVEELLTRAPGVKLLVTSRQRLDLPAEWLYEVTGLARPPQTWQSIATDRNELAEYPAIMLFAQRARRMDPRFQLADVQADVAHICHLVEGTPLAIELAAGWVRAFSCYEIATQIAQNLDFLTGNRHGESDRHSSLRATFRHSWNQLDAEERIIFTRLSIFRSGASLAAAQSVAGASHLVLARLVDKSMVRHVFDRATGHDRYSVHELLRHFGLEELTADERHATQRRHCIYFAKLLDGWRSTMRTSDEADTLRTIAAEMGDIRAAWLWLAARVACAEETAFVVQQVEQMLPMLAHFFFSTSRYDEGESLFVQMVEAISAAGWPNPHARTATERQEQIVAVLKVYLAEFHNRYSRFAAAVALIDECLPILQRIENPLYIGMASVTKGRALIRQGQYDAARTAIETALVAFEEVGDPLASTDAMNAMGILLSNQGHFDEAEDYYRICLDLFRASNYARGISNLLSNLGSNYARNGLFAEARPLYEESYAIARQGNDRLVTGAILSNLGSISRALGDFAAAVDYYEQGLALFRAMREQRWTAASLNGLGLTLVDLGDVDAAATCVVEALQIAHEIQSKPDMLDALAVIGEIYAQRGEIDFAATILHLVAHHSVTQTLARARSEKAIEEMNLPLVSEDGTLTLEEVVALVLRSQNILSLQ